MTYGRVDVWTHVFLTSALVGGEWSASHPGRFTPGEGAPGTNWIGNWVGPRASMDSLHPTTKLLLNYRTVLLLSQMSDYATPFVNNRNDQYMEFLWFLIQLAFRRNTPPPFSGSKNKLVYARLILRPWKRRLTCSSETSMVLERTTRHYTESRYKSSYIHIRQPQMLQSLDSQICIYVTYVTAHHTVTCHDQPPTTHWLCR
jgi:hypothetical protein